jgi:hypothetical protein
VEHPEYLLRFDDVNDRVRNNQSKNALKHRHRFKTLNDTQKSEQIMSSGLNNLEYTILERKMIHNIVELIKVQI